MVSSISSLSQPKPRSEHWPPQEGEQSCEDSPVSDTEARYTMTPTTEDTQSTSMLGHPRIHSLRMRVTIGIHCVLASGVTRHLAVRTRSPFKAIYTAATTGRP